MSRDIADGATPVTKWLDELADWYRGIAENSHYQEKVYCYFDLASDKPDLKFSVVLEPTPAAGDKAADGEPPAKEERSPAENTTKRAAELPATIERSNLKNLLPTRAEARGRVALRALPAAVRAPQNEAKSATPDGNKALRMPQEAGGATVSDFKSTAARSFSINNTPVDYAFHMASSSALNEDLLKLLVRSPPPANSPNCISLAVSLSSETRQDPCLQTDAGRYGILLRAALVAKVAGSKGNLALYINRLEDLREMFGKAEELPISAIKRARLMRSLWDLLEDVREKAPVIPGALRQLPTELRPALTGSPRVRLRDLGDLAWYRWNLTLPVWISKHVARLTKLGHLLAYAAFASLLLLSLHSALAPVDGAFADWLAHIAAWRSRALPDGATLAMAFAAAAGVLYALTTQRLTMPERVALSINDKIEGVLDSAIADLMKANMDVQIGRLGRGEPPGLIPESVARKLDEAFALKELVNSYESTVRARLRHVAHEVRKAQNIRLESHQRVRNAALGVTASFVLLEIGSRIQDHRDLQAGTDSMSYAYWLHRQDGAAAAGSPHAVAAPSAILDCARTEIVQQKPSSPECLDQWRESSLASSSQLLFLVFLIALLMFVVRVMRRGGNQDAS
ncbi:hypothetical protein [Achromobacter agilis]|uniref:Uncharacterized protein n=1 Tax=Achromobacter agilis TaxID=1353888 RepID=A0A446CKY4_9BURK|nr:hypothetical protein [Achromobacter agilis]SSW68540.1 hypothetical protein AGI3411_03732 [Achromobacter agilis]